MPDNPPDALDALKAALRVEREARQQAEARAAERVYGDDTTVPVPARA